MKLSQQQLKAIGANYLAELNVLPELVALYVNTGTVLCFIPNDAPCFVEPVPVSPGSELARRIKFAEKNGAKCFAVTREYFLDTGITYSLLLVSPYEADLEETFKACDAGCYRVYAYVWNVDDDKCSEYGSVYVKAYNGLLRRIG